MVYRSTVCVGLALAALLLTCVTGCDRDREQSRVPADVPEVPAARREVEREIQQAGGMLLRTPYGLPEDAAGRRIRFGLETLATHQLYITIEGSDAFVRIEADGSVSGLGNAVPPVREGGELLITPSGTFLFVDGAPVPLPEGNCTINWIATTETAPTTESVALMPVDFRDAFMRTALETESCRVTHGEVALAQHGGGMVLDYTEELDASRERAVNPFTVHAENNGRLTYEIGDVRVVPDMRVGVSFCFGVPKTGDVVDRQTVPTDTNMMVAVGPEDGTQVAFGWVGGREGFALMVRDGERAWECLDERGEARPPITNWFRLELVVHGGHRVTGLLDGVVVAEAVLPVLLAGPYHILSGRGLAEFDDVSIQSLPVSESGPTPLCVRSKQFAGKRRKGRADPAQFREWAESSGAFKRQRWSNRDDESRRAGIVTSLPLIGPFEYRSVARSARSGSLPDSNYEFALYAVPEDLQLPSIEEARPVWCMTATRREGIWTFRPTSLDGDIQPEVSVEDLVLVRPPEAASRLYVVTPAERVAVCAELPQAVHLGIVRRGEAKRFLFSPSPNHHDVAGYNLVQELFETAPTDWSWVEGAFRMDTRWACQSEWNFMSCGSPGVPFMASKRHYMGDQHHEWYLALRAAFPWDAGDKTFEYDDEEDRRNGFSMLNANHAWYNRRDLNVSICNDGRNPASGYSIVFGGRDNRETMLLRNGEVVARTADPDFLFPTGESHLEVHWNWWKFTTLKVGPRLVVRLNDDLLFDYTDPEPLEGGHVAFWTVRNAFALSRVTSMATQVEWRPHTLYTTGDAPSPWEPLRTDSVVLTPGDGGDRTRVTLHTGGGFAAVRYTPESSVDVSRTPVLELPLTQSAGARLALHLQVGSRALVVPVGEVPIEGMKDFLVPMRPGKECFQLPEISATRLRRRHLVEGATLENGVLRVDLSPVVESLLSRQSDRRLLSVTVGNSSNKGYLLAGHGGNRAGDWYEVGTPTFSAR